MLDNVRAYTAGCFQQCFLSFRFALPSLLQGGVKRGLSDQLLHIDRIMLGNEGKERKGVYGKTKEDPREREEERGSI